jgi:hypothetical protein
MSKPSTLQPVARVVCSLSIPLDIGPMAPNKLLRKHWAVRQKFAKMVDNAAFAYWHRAGRPRAIGPVIVTYTVRRARKLDNDGCLGALKFLTDGLFKNRITPDDSPEWVTFNPVCQLIQPKWQGAPEVVVLVEEIG